MFYFSYIANAVFKLNTVILKYLLFLNLFPVEQWFSTGDDLVPLGCWQCVLTFLIITTRMDTLLVSTVYHFQDVSSAMTEKLCFRFTFKISIFHCSTASRMSFHI